MSEKRFERLTNFSSPFKRKVQRNAILKNLLIIKKVFESSAMQEVDSLSFSSL